MVSPLEAKLIRVEAGKSRDRSVEGLRFVASPSRRPTGSQIRGAPVVSKSLIFALSAGAVHAADLPNPPAAPARQTGHLFQRRFGSVALDEDHS